MTVSRKGLYVRASLCSLDGSKPRGYAVDTSLLSLLRSTFIKRNKLYVKCVTLFTVIVEISTGGILKVCNVFKEFLRLDCILFHFIK